MKIEWHHWLIMILAVFIGAALVRRNFLGVPGIVDNLVGNLTGVVSGVTRTA